MVNIQDVKDETLAIIDGALAILQKYPDLNQTDISLSYNSSLNPLPFLMDLFKRTAGYNVLINIISKLIAFNIPIIEVGIKGVLIAKLKDIISCSVNPFFTEEILTNGIVFNAAEIDIADVLKYSPFDDIGKNFYFDNGDYEEEYIEMVGDNAFIKKRFVSGIPDDLIKSNDLNCLIWYVINETGKRHVWKPKKYRKGPEFRTDYPHNDTDFGEMIIDYQREMYDIPKQELDEALESEQITQEVYEEKLEKLQEQWLKLRYKYTKNFNKLKKEDGIITLEFHHRSEDVVDAFGNSLPMQTPYGNCLHVFIGDAREKETGTIMQTLKDSTEAKRSDDKDIKQYIEQLESLNQQLMSLEQEKQDLLTCGYITERDFQRQFKKIQKKIYRLTEKIEQFRRNKEISQEDKQRLQHLFQTIKNKISESISQSDTVDIYFPFINSGKVRNYYYGKSLIEFNIDYITSLELFDAKTLTSRLLDCLTASLVIDLHLSYKQQLIKNEVKKMVQMITETDDLVVSDCFFTFSNKDYDEMTRKAELRKAGLLTINGDETSAVRINAQNIFSKLNEINKDTNKETIQTIITGAITEISKELSNTEYLHTDDVNFGVEINFIENILQSLAEAITMTVLSPKLYLLLLINLKIIGRETNFNLEGFLEQYKQIIADIIRSIRDIILEYLTKELMAIIGNLVKEITLKFSVEQAMYWQRLYKKIIECFKRNRFNLDFSIDDVDYADILPEETEPKNNEC